MQHLLNNLFSFVVFYFLVRSFLFVFKPVEKPAIYYLSSENWEQDALDKQNSLN